jgi:hypothetical protein
LRAQGNGFGITGWAIGVGMTTLVNPIMFDAMKVRSSHPVVDGTDHFFPEPHVFSLRWPQFDLDTHRVSLYVLVRKRASERPKLITVVVYPETRNRSLESIEALFSTPSPFYWKMEQAYALHGDVLVEHGAKTNDRLDATKNQLTSFEKPEEQRIV